MRIGTDGDEEVAPGLFCAKPFLGPEADAGEVVEDTELCAEKYESFDVLCGSAGGEGGKAMRFEPVDGDIGFDIGGIFLLVGEAGEGEACNLGDGHADEVGVT